MPLRPMHVPLAVPIPPSDAVATPTVIPDTKAARNRPSGILSFALTLRMSISCSSQFARCWSIEWNGIRQTSASEQNNRSFRISSKN